MTPFLKIGTLLLIVSFMGCGYHLTGTGGTLPPHLKSIAIPVFANTSGEPDIHRQLTGVVRQRFISDGRLTVIDSDGANLLMKAAITRYELQAATFSSSDIAQQYWVKLWVDVELIDQVKEETFLKQSFNTKWDFESSEDVINSEAARLIALNQAYDDFASSLVSIIVEQF